MRLGKLVEPLNPFFVEDPVRAITDPGQFSILRKQVSVPLELENSSGTNGMARNRSWNRGLSIMCGERNPMSGGITEYMKIAALCETHCIGLAPHFTAPISTAAVIHAVTAFPWPVINEVLTSALPAYLKEGYDFKDGKIYPNDRPGIGVVFDSGRVNLISEITQPRDLSGYLRPDRSLTSL